MADYGVITEQGDLGLGFDKLNEKDNKTVNEAYGSKDNDKTVINENKDNK